MARKKAKPTSLSKARIDPKKPPKRTRKKATSNTSSRTSARQANRRLNGTVRELRETTNRLRLAMEAGHMGAWDWDLRTDVAVCNDREFELLGLEPGAVQMTGTSFFARVHPDDREGLREAVDRCQREGIKYDREFRIVRADNGEIRWLAGQGDVIRDDRGQALRLIGVNFDVTPRKEVERQIKRAKDELTDLVENATIGLRWVGADGTILWANSRELALLGYNQDEYFGRPLSQFHADPEVGRDILKRFARHESLHDYEARLWCKDGTVKHVLIDTNEYREDGQFVHTRCFTRDITQRNRAETALKELNERLEERVAHRTRQARLLQDMAVAANESPSIERALGMTLGLVCEYDGWKVGHVYLPAGDGSDQFAPSDIWYAKADAQYEPLRQATMQTRFSPGLGFIGRVLQSGKPEWVEDIRKDKSLLHDVAGVRAAVAIPVLVEKEVVAVLEFFADRVARRDEQFLELMAGVGTQLSRVVERQRTAAELTESEQKFRLLVDGVSDHALLMLDDDGHVITWNAGAQRLYGYAGTEIIGRHFECLYPPAEVKAGWPRQFLERTRECGRAEDGGWRIRRDGSQFYADVVLTALRDVEGRLGGFAKITRDVTNRKSLEREVLDIATREQQRIGGELHDTVIQQLIGGELMAESLRQKLTGSVTPSTQAAGELVQILKEAQRQVRHLLHSLMPVEVDAAGLMAALESLAGQTEEMYDVSCEFHCGEQVLLYDNETSTHLYRIAQEAVHNAVKHGFSQRVTIELVDERPIRLTVRDDGRGIQGDLENKAGSGIRIMRYRAGVIGGKLDIATTTGEGTAVTCSVQLKE